MAYGPITSWEIEGETVETVSDFFFRAPKSLQMVTAAMKLKDAYSLEGKLWPTQIAETLLCQQRSVWSRLWFFQWSCMDVRVGLWRKLSTDKLVFLNCGVEKTLESPLDCKEIQPAHPKGDQSWIFIGRTDVKAETPVLWPPHAKSWLIGKTLMLGEIGGRRRGRQRMRYLDGITD